MSCFHSSYQRAVDYTLFIVSFFFIFCQIMTIIKSKFWYCAAFRVSIPAEDLR